MPNPYFKFKQFTILQDRCAMKVCTDACLFGAVVADNWLQRLHGLRPDPIDDQIAVNILDIGTGTGLLSLMLSQKLNARIDAIEIEIGAYQQARENLMSSPWAQHINVIHADVTFHQFDKNYDIIISNPPFFEKDLHSKDYAINQARHDKSLTLENCLKTVSGILAPEGIFALLLPFHRTDYSISVARYFQLHLHAVINVRHSFSHPFFRSILFIGKESLVKTEEAALEINNANGYSQEFTRLLKDYYLHL